MKTLKTFCLAAILVTALSVSAFGGEISTPGLTSEETPEFTTPPEEMDSPDVTEAEPGDTGSPGWAEILWILCLVY